MVARFARSPVAVFVVVAAACSSSINPATGTDAGRDSGDRDSGGLCGGRYCPEGQQCFPGGACRFPSDCAGVVCERPGEACLPDRGCVAGAADDDADGFTVRDGDCNDTAPSVNPSATEVCNGADDDCDGSIDEGITSGMPCNTGLPGVCAAGLSGCVDGGTGCVQTQMPGAESCNGMDDDCDGMTDEDDPGSGGACDSGMPGLCGPGTRHCAGGMLQCTPTVPPSVEVCMNAKDDDCDGMTDESPCFVGH